MPPRRTRSSLLFDLFAASQQVKSLLAAAMEEAGLGADSYAVYSALFEFEPLTPSELAGGRDGPQRSTIGRGASMSRPAGVSTGPSGAAPSATSSSPRCATGLMTFGR